MLKTVTFYYYTIIVLYILVRGFLRGKDRSMDAYTIIVLLTLPFIGALYMLVSKLSLRNYTEVKNTHLLQLTIDEKKATLDRNLYHGVNIEKETNIVPIEEALLVNSRSIRRRMILDLLKEDAQQYSSLLYQAAGNEDTETAHYAVTGILEIKRKVMIELQHWSVQYERHKDDAHVLRSYADVLKRFMASGFLDERTLRKYRGQYSQVLGELLDIDQSDLTAFEEKVNCDLELNWYDQADLTCTQIMKVHPDKEISYVLRMKLAYTMKSPISFRQALDALKKSPVQVSNTTLNYIRFWSKGVGR